MLNTSKWKHSVPDWIPLSSCLIDSSSVVTCSVWQGDFGLSSCGSLGSVRAGGNWRTGAARPGPGMQGRAKVGIKMHRNAAASRALGPHVSPSAVCSPLRLMSRASSLECDSLLARMNMTTWSCVCSEMSRPLMSTTRSPSRSLGSQRPAYKQTSFIFTLS